MTSKFVYNKPWIVKWVSDKIAGSDNFPLDSPCFGFLENGVLKVAVVYTMYSGVGVCMNVAIDGGRFRRSVLREAFAIPFERLGCTRVSGLVRADNLAAQRFDEHLGFKREGLIRQGDDDGCDLILYGMLKSECRWLGI